MPDHEDQIRNNSNQSTQEQRNGPSMPGAQQNQGQSQNEPLNISNIPPELYQAICNHVTQTLFSQLHINPPNLASQSQSNIPTVLQPHRKANRWPEWDGNVMSFEAHVYSLRIKIEEDKQLLGSDRSICLGIFNSIPTEKQPRILQWYRTGGPTKNHNWEQFLDHIVDQFEDKQARQNARSQLQRMRMGPNQYFLDFLQDFELKLSQCGNESYTDEAKIALLENGINETLSNLLLNKSLPDDDYA